MNQYQKSILSVGMVLTKYEADQKFAVSGFGAIFGGVVSSCFRLTFDDNNVEVDGIMGAYKNSIQKVTLYEPTDFTPIISREADNAVRSFEESKTYCVLLILTDGEIMDLPDTIDAIVDSTDKRLSIITIGVENANFDRMDTLDADKNPLISSEGVEIKRDIVQFVPFKKFKKKSTEKLENEVLAEIPRLFHEFCSSHGFNPSLPENDIM